MGEIRRKRITQMLVVCVIGLISIYCTERKLVSTIVSNNQPESISTSSVAEPQPSAIIADKPKDNSDKEKIIIAPITITSPIIQDDKQTQVLTIGKVIEQGLKNDEYHLYEIEIGADQYLQATVMQQGIDVVVSVIDPSGKKVYEVDSPNGTQGPELIYLITEREGKYKLEVRSLEKTAPLGKYEVKLEQLRSANQEDRPRVAAYKALGEAVILGAQQDLKSVEAAIARYEAAIHLFEEAKDEIQIAFSCNRLAELYRLVANYSKAEPLYQRALSIREKALGADHLDVAQLLNNLAELYQDNGDYSKAEPLYQRALSIREKVLGADHPLVAHSLNNLAALYNDKGDYSKVESLLQRALAIREKVLGAEHSDVANSLNNLAVFYETTGNYNKAEPLFQRALSIREKALGADHLDVANSLNNLAGLYEDKSKYDKAEPLYKRALTIYEKVLGADHPLVAQVSNNLALLYYGTGNYNKAEPLFQRALAIREKALGADHPDVANSLNNLAGLYKDKNDYNKAEPLYKRALAIYEKALGANHSNTAIVLNNLALLYHKNGEYDKAEPFYQRVLTILEKALGAEHVFVANALNNLAELYRDKGDYSKAEPIYQRSLAISKKVLEGAHPLIANALNNLAELYDIRGKYNQAINYKILTNECNERDLIRNLVAGSENEKLLYLKRTSHDIDYTLSLHLQSAPNNLDILKAAMTIVLQRKGRALDVMTQSIKTLRRRAAPEDQLLLDKLAQARAQLSALILRGPSKEGVDIHKADLKVLADNVEALEKQISTRSAEFKVQITPITLLAVQQSIPTDAALIEFAVYRPYDAKNRKYADAHYAVYMLKNNGELKWAELGDAAAIDNAITTFRNVLIKQEAQPLSDIDKEVKPAARLLDKLVMEKVRSRLGNTTRLFIAPDGNLNLIPFDSLVDEQGKYLVENYEISYLTSGRDLLRLQNGIGSEEPTMVMADPNYGDEQGPGTKMGNYVVSGSRLKETAIEAQQIKQIFNLKPEEILLQDKATKTALKQMHRPDILHISTHGFFLKGEQLGSSETKRIRIGSSVTDEGNEKVTDAEVQKYILNNPLLQSGLLFAGVNEGRGDEGVLTALEATALDLWGTKLVVLSACDTGIGEVKNGDGVYGLRRALVLAGSESQLMSLWPVSDVGTRELMIKYYEALKNDEGRSAGLRRVRQELLKDPKRAHPYYWASFIQSGEWANLNGKR